jgi:hypothetical protein
LVIAKDLEHLLEAADDNFSAHGGAEFLLVADGRAERYTIRK